jgi:hypothetical protein
MAGRDGSYHTVTLISLVEVKGIDIRKHWRCHSSLVLVDWDLMDQLASYTQHILLVPAAQRAVERSANLERVAFCFVFGIRRIRRDSFIILDVAM